MNIDETLRTRYLEYTKKYDLPSLEQLNEAFEVRDAIMHEEFVPEYLLRFIRRRIIAILDSWTNYLHSILMPGQQSMILYEESNKFSEEEKEKAMSVMKKIVKFNRMSVILEVEQAEEKDAAFVKQAYDAWRVLHKDLKPFAEKSLSVWSDEVK